MWAKVLSHILLSYPSFFLPTFTVRLMKGSSGAPLPTLALAQSRQAREPTSIPAGRKIRRWPVQTGACVSAAAWGLTGVEVLDVGLLSLSLQLLPSDGFCFLHLELHLMQEKGGSDGENLRRGRQRRQQRLVNRAVG